MRKSVVYSFFFLYLDLFFGLFFFFIHHTHIYIHLFYVNCCCGRAKWHSFTIIISFFRLCFFSFLRDYSAGLEVMDLACLSAWLISISHFCCIFFLREKKRRKRGGTTATAIISLPLKRRSQNIKWKCNFLVDHGWFDWWIRRKCEEDDFCFIWKFASWSLSRVTGPHSQLSAYAIALPYETPINWLVATWTFIPGPWASAQLSRDGCSFFLFFLVVF